MFQPWGRKIEQWSGSIGPLPHTLCVLVNQMANLSRAKRKWITTHFVPHLIEYSHPALCGVNTLQPPRSTVSMSHSQPARSRCCTTANVVKFTPYLFSDLSWLVFIFYFNLNLINFPPSKLIISHSVPTSQWSVTCLILESGWFAKRLVICSAEMDLSRC